jgi:hypothetical protein
MGMDVQNNKKQQLGLKTRNTKTGGDQVMLQAQQKNRQNVVNAAVA